MAFNPQTGHEQKPDLTTLLALIAEERYADLDTALAALPVDLADLLAYHLLAHRLVLETPPALLDVLVKRLSDGRLTRAEPGQSLLNHGWPRLVVWRLAERWRRYNWTRPTPDASTLARLDDQLHDLLARLEAAGADYTKGTSFPAAAGTVRHLRMERYLVGTFGTTDGAAMMRFIKTANECSWDGVRKAAWIVFEGGSKQDRALRAKSIADDYVIDTAGDGAGGNGALADVFAFMADAMTTFGRSGL